MSNFFKDLIVSDSGVSSKAFFLVAVTVIGCLMLLAGAFVLVYEVIKTGTIHTDLRGLATYITAISALFATAGLTKAVGERNERKRYNDDETKK
ncbi:MAG: hypothetical protein LKE54_07340 [Prevotella sp.]|jgi:hypothetical protein|nr:hypothetical protein [Prevotella sp.]MCH3994847.1 hypothetical protein [Prevotella sp.]